MTRFKLGIPFLFSSQWMGGIIYVLNIIKTLDFLKDEEKPEIYLFYKSELKKFIGEINYPYLRPIEWKFPGLISGNLASLLMRKNVFIHDILNSYSLDALYPLDDAPVRINSKTRLVAWYADLQHKYYPEFFTRKQVAGRNIRTWNMLQNNDDLVVSSQSVLDDFRKFYKLRKNLKVHVFRFVSIIDDLQGIEISSLRAKYNLPAEYFMVSNQFHKHKNHKILLLALAKLKEKGIHKHVVMTGKFPNAAGSPYIAELHKIIEDYDLKSQIVLLGVISRKDQLQIMRHSQAVIQPSRFEGWSTVIEDAKSLQVPVIASDLKVNIEQLGDTGTFFGPDDPQQLAMILTDYPNRDLNDILYEDYSKRVTRAAQELMEIFRN